MSFKIERCSCICYTLENVYNRFIRHRLKKLIHDLQRFWTSIYGERILAQVEDCSNETSTIPADRSPGPTGEVLGRNG